MPSPSLPCPLPRALDLITPCPLPRHDVLIILKFYLPITGSRSLALTIVRVCVGGIYMSSPIDGTEPFVMPLFLVFK